MEIRETGMDLPVMMNGGAFRSISETALSISMVMSSQIRRKELGLSTTSQ
ncbi:hypothetical protein Lser_V15G29410 [Lactuca serriola]